MIYSLLTWNLSPLYVIVLFFDAIAYTLVSYSFKLVMIMSQLNMNIFYALLSPIIDRVKALIMVLIMFKLGVSFLQYIADPDKTKDSKIGGAALVKNIFITVAILGIYNFVFDLGNDISMLVLGSYGGNEAYKVVSPPEESSGLLARFVFGSNAGEFDSENFGKSLAVTTLSLFLNDEEDSNVKAAAIVYNDILENEKEDTDFFNIITLNNDIGRTVYYQVPILSTIVGLYLVYNLVIIAMEIGIRMIKLMVLQIIAPIPICSIISEGPGGKMFTGFYQLYISTLISAFIRVGSVYIITAFIGVFYEQLMTGTTNIFGSTSIQMTGFTKVIIIAMVIVAGYKFVKDLPDFLKKIFGDIIPDADKYSFGKVLGNAGRAVIGVGTGLTAGLAGGSGILGTAYNMLAGGYSGARGDKISDVVKNNSSRAADLRSQGGLPGYALRGAENISGITQFQQDRATRHTNAGTAADNLLKVREQALSDAEIGTTGRKYGTKDQYVAQESKYNAAYLQASATYDAARKRYGETGDSGALTAMQTAQRTMDSVQKSLETNYENELFSNNDVNSDSSVQNAQRIYESTGGKNNDNYKQVKNRRNEQTEKSSNIEQGYVLGRANRNKGNGGK